MEMIIITGLSGSGKSRTINILEDIGFFCVDNLPPKLISKFVQIGEASKGNLSSEINALKDLVLFKISLKSLESK